MQNIKNPPIYFFLTKARRNYGDVCVIRDPKALKYPSRKHVHLVFRPSRRHFKTLHILVERGYRVTITPSLHKRLTEFMRNFLEKFTVNRRKWTKKVFQYLKYWISLGFDLYSISLLLWITCQIKATLGRIKRLIKKLKGGG